VKPGPQCEVRLKTKSKSFRKTWVCQGKQRPSGVMRTGKTERVRAKPDSTVAPKRTTSKKKRMGGRDLWSIRRKKTGPYLPGKDQIEEKMELKADRGVRGKNKKTSPRKHREQRKGRRARQEKNNHVKGKGRGLGPGWEWKKDTRTYVQETTKKKEGTNTGLKKKKGSPRRRWVKEKAAHPPRTYGKDQD